MQTSYDRPEDQKRISILVTKEIHKSIKRQALNADQSMKDYIINLLMGKSNNQILRE